MFRLTGTSLLTASCGFAHGQNTRTDSNSIVIQPGPFSAAEESFRGYTCPEWFRDAKFGLWAHWGPTSAIEDGDWYARNMYIEGNPQYEYHLKTYGHPSKFGYKDTIPLWRAERFDPKALIQRYVQAGAKYFVSMGVHCDNFDLWNSRGRRWNSVRMGPKRDIVREWRDAARAAGLRFGVSEHVWASYNWWITNKGTDKHGPYAGVPYDGNDPANWDLYFPPHAPGSQAWAEQGNESTAWKREWFLRAQDLMDQHEPDLYYEDGPIPFGEWGRSLVAHYYNQSLRRHGGKVDVVYTAKQRTQCATGACTLDLERGVAEEIEPHPFQTDTCIGDWHYKRGIRYKTPKIVIDLLVDVVSRNGNLLLNIPLPASGMPDDEELRILDELTAWMKVNSEGIYGTRPWKIYGEGPSTQKSAPGGGMNGTSEHFNERQRRELTPSDIRFTTKAGAIYAFVMGHNTNETRIAALSPSRGLEFRPIARVELLGSTDALSWKLTSDGLTIAPPKSWPSQHAITLKITFDR
ncbi:MAG TPA: alpha-L-fucosidase [Bryobacteraceae bacterium]|nr:alpha-L-fucosidase [Bryobacteraceae bacterium]